MIERVALGALTRVFPPDLVDVVVAKTGTREERVRLLPSRLMVYFVLGRALFSPAPYREVARTLTHTLCEQDGWTGWRVPDKAALARARQRLGTEPFRELLGQIGPVAEAGTAGAWWRGWRLMAVDATLVEVADSPANEQEFGRHRCRPGQPSGYPQAKVVALIETGTHVVVDAVIGPGAAHEQSLAGQLVDRLAPDMLVLADRGFPGVPLWEAMAATGAQLLWRVSSRWKLEPEQILPDGSWISTVRTGNRARRPTRQTRVRVVEYRMNDPGRDPDQRYRLITTFMDPGQAPAAELAALYAERWEAETTLAECKSVQIGAGMVLPSRSPPLIRQDIYAHLAVHAALRALMCTTATAQDPPLDPDRLSFSAALRAARRSVLSAPVAFSP
ncbi:IS4 family transposase [Nonomuraea angiospora]